MDKEQFREELVKRILTGQTSVREIAERSQVSEARVFQWLKRVSAPLEDYRDKVIKSLDDAARYKRNKGNVRGN